MDRGKDEQTDVATVGNKFKDVNIHDDDKKSPIATSEDVEQYRYITSTDALGKAVKEIKEFIEYGKAKNDIALNMEGLNISRAGKISLLALATPNMVFLIDLLMLGPVGFDHGLRELLEDTQINKLMFDCREQSDALWHLFDVQLTGVKDVQLLEIIYQMGKDFSPVDGVAQESSDTDIILTKSLTSCTNYYLKNNDLQRMSVEPVQTSQAVWLSRPLPHSQLLNETEKVKSIFRLYKVLETDEDGMNHLRHASEAYCKILRSMVMRRYNEFEINQYLPVSILPQQESVDMKIADTKCTGCLRLLPYDLFLEKEVSDGTQMCRVCKKIEAEVSVQKQPQSNPVHTFKDTYETQSWRYFDDDDDRYDDSYDKYDDYDQYEDQSEEPYIEYECGLRERISGFGDGSSEWQFYYP